MRVDRAVVEELAVGLEAVADALRVIEAVDAEHDLLRIAELLANFLRPREHGRVLRELVVHAHVNGDREAASFDRAVILEAEAGHDDLVFIGAIAEQLTHARREIDSVALTLETEQIRAEKPAQN